MPHHDRPTPSPTGPLILFGACDRHNLGDLLFPHIARALLPAQPVWVAGLAERDLRACGGDHVRALAGLLARPNAAGARLLHVGGELMTCDPWQAAVMLLPPEQADAVLTRAPAPPYACRAWLRGMLGAARAAPYCVAPADFPALSRVAYTGLGGVALDELSHARRVRILGTLRQADAILARDARSLAHLRAAGITVVARLVAPAARPDAGPGEGHDPQSPDTLPVCAALAPDPVVMIAELYGARIRAHMDDGPVATMRARHPNGYIAAQFGGEFADDATLTALAAQLDRIAARGRGIVLFRAGAAPWHDSLERLRHLADATHGGGVSLFTSIDVWDICALIAASQGYCGSSLHGRIVAGAYALPRITVRPPAGRGDAAKQAAYIETWEPPAMQGVADIDALAVTMLRAFAVDAAELRRHAALQVRRYRRGFGNLAKRLLES